MKTQGLDWCTWWWNFLFAHLNLCYSVWCWRAFSPIQGGISKMVMLMVERADQSFCTTFFLSWPRPSQRLKTSNSSPSLMEAGREARAQLLNWPTLLHDTPHRRDRRTFYRCSVRWRLDTYLWRNLCSAVQIGGIARSFVKKSASWYVHCPLTISVSRSVV